MIPLSKSPPPLGHSRLPVTGPPFPPGCRGSFNVVAPTPRRWWGDSIVHFYRVPAPLPGRWPPGQAFVRRPPAPSSFSCRSLPGHRRSDRFRVTALPRSCPTRSPFFRTHDPDRRESKREGMASSREAGAVGGDAVDSPAPAPASWFSAKPSILACLG